MVKYVGTFQNFSGGLLTGSWMLLHFLGAVRVLSSEFTEACFPGIGPSVPLPYEQFPPSFEPYPGADEPNAVILGMRTGPKQGVLRREYPGDHENIATTESVPPGFLSIDTTGPGLRHKSGQHRTIRRQDLSLQSHEDVW